MSNSKSPTVSEAVARPTRTSLMFGVAVFLVGYYNDHIDHLTRDEKAWAVGVTLAVVNVVWVQVENYLGVALLRNVPPKRSKVLDTDDGPPFPVPSSFPETHVGRVPGRHQAGPAPQVVRIHPDDLAALAALRPTPRRRRPADRD